MAFLKPLAKEKEAFYLRRLKEGDEAAKVILIEHNMRLVSKIANQFKNISLDFDDLMSIGKIGLIKALNSFDQSKSKNFSTFAFRCISNEFLMVYEKLKKEFKIKYLNKYHDQDNQSLINDLKDDQVNIEAMYLITEANQELYQILNQLDDLGKIILILRFGLYDYKVHTQGEIARELNISRSYVSRLENDALKKARIIAKRLTKAYDKSFNKKEALILNGINIKGYFKMRDTEEEFNWLKEKITGVTDNELLFLLKKGFLKEEIVIFYFYIFSNDDINEQLLINNLDIDSNLTMSFIESLSERFYQFFQIDLKSLIIDNNCNLELIFPFESLEYFNNEYQKTLIDNEPKRALKLLIGNYLKELNKGKNYIWWQPKNKVLKR